ncbi:MAG: hypothetical protein IJ514_06860 [Clostridia bacterium]|nr:hypothetical protein [Clostridia bacterium]
MATLMEERTMHLTAEKEAELHNAQIKERYRRLQNAEADQFAEVTEEVRSETQYAVRASVLAPEAPAVEQTPVTQQTPQVTEFVRERIETPVFTTERLERAMENAPVLTKPVEIPMQMQTTATSVATEAQYSLSRMAKLVMAAFATVVVLMLTLICINTQIIQRKSMQLRSLEQQREELVERNEEIQRRIETAQSEEAIREYALSQGMIQG